MTVASGCTNHSLNSFLSDVPWLWSSLFGMCVLTIGWIPWWLSLIWPAHFPAISAETQQSPVTLCLSFLQLRTMENSYHTLTIEELEAAIEKTWEKVHSLTPALHRFTQSLQSVELHLAAAQKRGCLRVALLQAERDRLRRGMSLWSENYADLHVALQRMKQQKDKLSSAASKVRPKMLSRYLYPV